MSAGTANPTTWPRCLFPAAYGQAGATKIFCLCLSSAKDVLRSGEDHDTSRLCLGRAAERDSDPSGERQRNEKDDSRIAEQTERRRDLLLSRRRRSGRGA